VGELGRCGHGLFIGERGEGISSAVAMSWPVTGARRRRLWLARGVGERHEDAGEVSWLAREAPASSGYGGAVDEQRGRNGGCRGASGKGTKGEMTGEEEEDDGKSGRHQRTSYGGPEWSAEATHGAERQFCIWFTRSPRALRALARNFLSHHVN
jgi:hypothetical protein